jgi:hydrogenase maturation protein HypF
MWGGEFLLVDYLSFNRLAHFEYTPLLGGDKAQSEPWRMAYMYLKQHKIAADTCFSGKPTAEFDALLKSNLPLNYTSSVGRLFDAVAYLLGICTEKISYEAQAAIELILPSPQGSFECVNSVILPMLSNNSLTNFNIN